MQTKIVAWTSKIAYEDLKGCGKLNKDQKIIFDFLKKTSVALTDFEIARALGFWDPNKVRPRRRELELKGLVFCDGVSYCTVTGRKAKTWMVVKE